MIPLNAAGCVFPAGPGIALADLALRTGFSKSRRHPFYVDRSGERVVASYFNDPGTGFDLARWQSLTEAVLSDLLARLEPIPKPSLQQAPWQAWLVLPKPDRPGVPPDLAHALLPTLDTWPYELEGVEAIFGGHASGLKAIEAAAKACAAEPQSIALILAVDSLVGPETLTWLENRDLLHGARKIYEGYPRPNPYGRLPGEGAAALLLSNRHDLPAWCHITGMAWGEEPLTYDQPRPRIGQGLTTVARQALTRAAQYRQRPVRHLSHDYNGEPYRADEYGFTALRLADQLDLYHVRHTPALISGDLGAASAVAHTALAAWSCHRRPVGADHLILASSDDPLRSALVLHARESEAS